MKLQMQPWYCSCYIIYFICHSQKISWQLALILLWTKTTKTPCMSNSCSGVKCNYKKSCDHKASTQGMSHLDFTFCWVCSSVPSSHPCVAHKVQNIILWNMECLLQCLVLCSLGFGGNNLQRRKTCQDSFLWDGLASGHSLCSWRIFRKSGYQLKVSPS